MGFIICKFYTHLQNPGMICYGFFGKTWADRKDQKPYLTGVDSFWEAFCQTGIVVYRHAAKTRGEEELLGLRGTWVAKKGWLECEKGVVFVLLDY